MRLLADRALEPRVDLDALGMPDRRALEAVALPQVDEGVVAQRRHQQVAEVPKRVGRLQGARHQLAGARHHREPLDRLGTSTFGPALPSDVHGQHPDAHLARLVAHGVEAGEPRLVVVRGVVQRPDLDVDAGHAAAGHLDRDGRQIGTGAGSGAVHELLR